MHKRPTKVTGNVWILDLNAARSSRPCAYAGLLWQFYCDLRSLMSDWCYVSVVGPQTDAYNGVSLRINIVLQETSA